MENWSGYHSGQVTTKWTIGQVTTVVKSPQSGQDVRLPQWSSHNQVDKKSSYHSSPVTIKWTNQVTTGVKSPPSGQEIRLPQ